MKKWLYISLSALLIFTTLSPTTFAKSANEGSYDEKDEVVYGKLDANGATKNMYIVNSFHDIKRGKITDYGDYTNIRNLTDLSPIEQDGKTISFQAEDEEFYYQGELHEKTLPWNISITYKLDGKEIDPKKLAGKSGQLDMQMTIEANDDVDDVFIDYYLLQISITLDPLIFHDIQAPKGTIANEGKNKLINFSVMPGEEEELILSADVEDFEMDPIDISAIPANLAIDDPDVDEMSGEMKTLSDATRDIHQGVTELNDGIKELNDGTEELQDGSTDYLAGIEELDESSDELVEGSQMITDVLQQIEKEIDEQIDMPNVDEIDQLPQAFRNIAEGLESFADVFNRLDDAIDQIPNQPLNDEDIESLYQTLIENDADDQDLQTFNELVETYEAAQMAKTISENLPGHIANGAKDMAEQLTTVAREIEEALADMEQLDELAELQNGLKDLATEYATLHEGLVTYTEGVHSLATSYNGLNDGIHDLSDGTGELESGINELHDGTKELKEETSDLPSDMQAEIDEFMEDFDFSDFTPTSFVSTKNKNIGVVQFVLQTPSIKMEDDDETDETEEEDKGFWDRLLDLFIS